MIIYFIPLVDGISKYNWNYALLWWKLEYLSFWYILLIPNCNFFWLVSSHFQSFRPQRSFLLRECLWRTWWRSVVECPASDILHSQGKETQYDSILDTIWRGGLLIMLEVMQPCPQWCWGGLSQCCRSSARHQVIFQSEEHCQWWGYSVWKSWGRHVL